MVDTPRLGRQYKQSNGGACGWISDGDACGSSAAFTVGIDAANVPAMTTRVYVCESHLDTIRAADQFEIRWLDTEVPPSSATRD